jgi:hypothetical protein
MIRAGAVNEGVKHIEDALQTTALFADIAQLHRLPL